MKFKTSLLLASIATSPMVSQAAIVSGYGAYASTSTASNCPSYCTTAGGGDFQYDNDGGEFSITANSEENSYANARASASLASAGYLPTLRVETSAANNRGGFAEAFAVQGFTYDGTDPFTFNLNYDFHGSVGANPTGSISRNELRADVAVLIGNDLEFYPDWATLVYEVAYNLDNAGTDSLFISSGIDVNTSGSISFDLNAGDDFYIVSSVGARSVDGFADSFNTFTMNFDDDTGLTAATVNAVPVPAAVWLFSSGLIGLVGVARRKFV